MAKIVRHSFEFAQWVTMALALTASGFAVYWLYFQPAPLTYLDRVALTEMVSPGGEAVVRARVFKSADCPVTSVDFLRDSSKRIFGPLSGPPAAGFNEDIGRERTVYITIDIPEEASHGMACVYSVQRYTCNPLHDHIVRSPDACFEIVPEIIGGR